MAMRLTQGLHRAEQVAPDKVAVVDGGHRRTWRQVGQRVARLAAALKLLGIGHNDRAAILALNSHRYFEFLYAAVWAGGAAVPINIRLAAPEIDYILEDAGAKVLLIDDTFLHHLPQLKAANGLSAIIHIGDGAAPQGLVPYETAITESEPMEAADRAGDDLAGIYYTGGTTGQAKGVMLSHTNLVSNALNVMVALSYSRDSTYVHASPMFHLADGCSSFGVTMLGGRHVFMPRFDPGHFLKLTAQERVTDTTLVPTMIGMLVNHPDLAATDISSLLRIYYGAAPMPEGLIRQAIALLPGIKLQQAWGMTELSPIGCTIEPEYTTLEGPLAGRVRSCGRPVASIELRIVDALDREVPRGTVGEIIVRGPTVMLGYWNKPEETARALRNGWMHSSDAAYMDEEGFVFIVDRLKDMIVSGGENVYSAEVENALSLVDGVAEVAVIGVPDETYGEAVHAIVVPKAGVTLVEADVIAQCRARIAGYKCPRSITFRSEPLPLSGAGKILKSSLRAPFWTGRISRIV